MELLDDNAPRAITSISGAPSGSSSAASIRAAQLEVFSTVTARLSDNILMVLVARGNPHAFALLYERHARAAVALATQMCRRRAIAEEVVQEAFLSMWRSRRRFDPARGSVRAWMLGIVRNRAIDFLRRDVAHEVADVSGRAVESSLWANDLTDGEIGRRELSREILLALDGLPPEQSCVITLAYYGGYTHTEIATMLDTPVGTVKGRIRLGLRKMAHTIPSPR